MVLLAGYRGLRWGEAEGLRRDRLNLLRGRLEVAEILVEVVHAGALSFGPPKTAQGKRTVPLPAFLVEILGNHLATYSGGGHVFSTEGGQLLTPSNFSRNYWKPSVAKASVNPRLTFHGLLWHTAVSILAAEDAQLTTSPEIVTN